MIDEQLEAPNAFPDPHAQSRALNAQLAALGVPGAKPVEGTEPTADVSALERSPTPPEKERSKRRVSQSSKGQEENEEPPEAPRAFDPSPLVERLNVWWLNGKERYFQIRAEQADVLSLSEKDIKRTLRIAGVFSRAPEGKAYSQVDLVMQHIQSERHVFYAGPLAGKRMGVIQIQGKRILITDSFTLIEPEQGDWPTLRKVLEGMFKTAEVDQSPIFYAWLKLGIEALMAEETRPGHALILAGQSDCGKSFIQEHVITPLLGGRSADPTKYLLQKTQFNSELAGAEHLAMQELPSSIDYKSRSLFGQELKRLIATESHPVQPKYCDAVTVYPWWRVSLSINNNVDTLKALPALTSDFGDKVLLLLCESRPENLSGPSSEARRAFREAIKRELPAFVAFLLSWEIPAELQHTKHAARFGLDHFHHPDLTAALFEQEPQNSLLYILDNFTDLYKEQDAWGWEPAEKLREILCEDARFGPQSRKLFAFSGSCGTYLSKLADKFPNRFLHKHTRNANVWMIYRPEL